MSVSESRIKGIYGWGLWCYAMSSIVYMHRSSGAYEALRSSGCLRLPSQRTLRDSTHYAQASTGFSTEVDRMLMQAAKVSTCPEQEKCTILLLDEMQIREDLVFDKHTGAMIGFENLGDINDQLVQFEKSVTEDKPLAAPQLAKTMMVFMVRGLFSSLQFAYAQFPCAELTGELLYDPFWEAIRRVENCGLKVCAMVLSTNVHITSPIICAGPWSQVLGATLDGNAVNRRLIKLHQPSSDLLYKVRNPYAQEERFVFFFSDPPHLVKTIRNCWQSKARSLWVCLFICSTLVNSYTCLLVYPLNSVMGRTSRGVTSLSSTTVTHNQERELGCSQSSSLSTSP